MVDKYIQEKIVPNSDKYNPRQLTCFQRPWAILFDSVKEGYFDLFLFVSVFYENFMFDNYFYWEDFNKNLNDNFLKFAKDILEPRFGVKIDKIKYKNKETFINKIENSLINGNRILVPADLIELPYYEDYKEDNHVHFFIIRGFDKNKKIFYILDNMHIDNGANGIYKNFVFTYERMYKVASKSFESFFKDDTHYIWQLENREDFNKYTIQKALVNHKSELESVNNKHGLIKYPEDKIIMEGSKNINNFSRSYAKILNYKIVYYDILFKLLRKVNIPEKEIKNLEDKKRDLYKDWETLRVYILYYSSKENKDLTKLKKSYEKCILNEEEFRKCFINLVRDNQEKWELNIQNEEKDKYVLFEHNLNNAEIKRDKNNVSVLHSADNIYDTWKVQDNAAQLNFKINNKDKIEFSFDLSLFNNVDFPFFGGLIIKNKKGERFLFGNDAKCYIALYCPQMEQDFNLKKDEFYEDSMSLKVTIENRNVKFFYKEIGQKNWIQFYDMDILYIDEVGIISKTWNAIEHRNEFKNIKVFVNGEESGIYYV